ncbi:TonB-dependent receptor [Alteromonadales bacterium alter-6D02]|nr:TonB-dependent receptor [Alteromonadales bacterium alter-6D02]
MNVAMNTPPTPGAQTPAQEVIKVTGQTPLTNDQQGPYLLGVAQKITAEEIERSNAKTLTQQLKNTLVSVNINDVQNNPFQPDVQYRGFTASPLLGLPQGISVYLDGIRFNEPFGDTVNWDLIALTAIDNVTLYSGSNPVFGQNTLGGALALSVKDGFTYDGHELSAQAGSFGEKQLNVQSGGTSGNWGYYLNLNHYEEDGWRDGSPSEVKQYLANLSYKTDDLTADLLFATNNNTMIGNGTVPIELLEQESSTAIYTQPDQTKTNLNMLGLNITAALTEDSSLAVNAYYRKNEISSINGDDSDYDECEFGTAVTLCEGEDDDDDEIDGIESHGDDDDEGEEIEPVHFVGYNEGQYLSDIMPALDADDIDGTYNTGATDNESFGFSAQLVTQWGNGHELIIGGGADKADISFASDTQFAILHNDTAEDDRSVTPIPGLFDQESTVRLDTETTQYYFYLANRFKLASDLHLDIAGRYHDSNILMNDLIDDGEGSLDGDHDFSRFNPAIGLSYQISPQLTAKLSYSESSRNPSPAELSCADEDDPCKLPNGFVSDPPLKQVVVNTVELSLLGKDDNLNYGVTFFSTQSQDDIIFQQAGEHPARGYFVNIDETQRRGVELSASYRGESFDITSSYNYLDATFESPFVSFSPVNPLGPNRQVSPGDTIPGQPQHQIKLIGQYQATESFDIGSELSYASESYYRGDEANENQQIGSHTVVNLFANYQITQQLALELRVDNVFDRQYFTFGAYGEADEVLENVYPDIEDPYFVGPAKPRSVSVELSYQF